MTGKIISVLLVFANGSEHSLTEIARHAGLPVSTTHRLVVELAQAGILERTENLHYRVGSQLKSVIKFATPNGSPIEEHARRLLEDLAVANPRTTVRLGVLRGLEVRFLEKSPGVYPIPLSADGATMPAHSTAVGRALVAFSTPQVVEQVISHAVETNPSLRVDQLRRALAITRLTGFAVCRREHDLTTSAIAAPVFGVEREVVAALELETRNGRDVHALRAPLMVASQALSRQCRGLGVGTEFRLDAVVPARRAEIRPGARNGGQPQRL